jgi:hypothetical protein
MNAFPTMGQAIAAGEKLADALPPGWKLKLGFVDGKGWSWSKVGPPMTAADWPDAFEETLRQAAPRSTDPLEWARYNQWASEQRTRNQKETKT